MKKNKSKNVKIKELHIVQGYGGSNRCFYPEMFMLDTDGNLWIMDLNNPIYCRSWSKVELPNKEDYPE